ncbi:hypothetical protein [Accumulibacter sp.]
MSQHQTWRGRVACCVAGGFGAAVGASATAMAELVMRAQNAVEA